MANYKRHIYLLEKDPENTCVTLIFADTGNIYNEVINNLYTSFELTELLDDLIAQGEDDRDRESDTAFY